MWSVWYKNTHTHTNNYRLVVWFECESLVSCLHAQTSCQALKFSVVVNLTKPLTIFGYILQRRNPHPQHRYTWLATPPPKISPTHTHDTSLWKWAPNVIRERIVSYRNWPWVTATKFELPQLNRLRYRNIANLGIWGTATFSFFKIVNADHTAGIYALKSLHIDVYLS